MKAGTARIVHFYFNYQETLKQTAADLVACLLKQLIVPLGTRFHPCIQRLYENLLADPQIPRPGLPTLLEAFIQCSKQFGRTFVMLDAFDECDQNDTERERIVNMIEQLDNAGISVFVTAHTHSLETLKRTRSAGVEIRAHPDDIQYYIEANLSNSVNDELKSKIVKAISEKADGLYNFLSYYSDRA
jgi:hypothetical protein